MKLRRGGGLLVRAKPENVQHIIQAIRADVTDGMGAGRRKKRSREEGEEAGSGVSPLTQEEAVTWNFRYGSYQVTYDPNGEGLVADRKITRRGLAPTTHGENGQRLPTAEYTSSKARARVRAMLLFNDLDKGSTPKFQVHELDTLVAENRD